MMSGSENQFSLRNAASAWLAAPCGSAIFGRDILSRENVRRHRKYSPMKLMLSACGLLALLMPILVNAQAGGDTGLKNATVLVIRHAEKPDQGDDLSKAGKERAKAYVHYFESYTVDSQPLKLDYLFATADSKDSHRPRLTVEPLSKAIGLKIDSRFQETQNRELVAAIQKKQSGKQILICWHHEEIPQLLSALGADPDALLGAKKWPDDVFNWLIQLRYDSDGHVSEAKRINENLLPGDSNK
jgi:hypothetical protein